MSPSRTGQRMVRLAGDGARTAVGTRLNKILKWFGFGETGQQAPAPRSPLELERGGLWQAAYAEYRKLGATVDAARVARRLWELAPTQRERLRWLALSEELAPTAGGKRLYLEGRFELLAEGGGSQADWRGLAEELFEAEAWALAADGFLRGGAEERAMAALAMGGDDWQLEALEDQSRTKLALDHEKQELVQQVKLQWRLRQGPQAWLLASAATKRLPNWHTPSELLAAYGEQRPSAQGFWLGLPHWQGLVLPELPICFGRGGRGLKLTSPLVSRRQLELLVGADGDLEVRVPEGSGAVQMRGLQLAGPVSVGKGLQLELPGGTPVSIEPQTPGIWQVASHGQRLGIVDWQALGADLAKRTGVKLALRWHSGWLMARAEQPSPRVALGAEGLTLQTECALLRGDCIRLASVRDGDPLLSIGSLPFAAGSQGRP